MMEYYSSGNELDLFLFKTVLIIHNRSTVHFFPINWNLNWKFQLKETSLLENETKQWKIQILKIQNRCLNFIKFQMISNEL